MWFIWYIIFAHPHPDVTCMYPPDGITRLWGMGIVVGFILAIALYTWFYYFSLPTKNALKKYWAIFIIVPILCAIILSGSIILNKDSLIDELCMQSYARPLSTINLNIILASIITALEMNIITAVLFILLGRLPIKSRMKAMRNYPFPL